VSGVRDSSIKLFQRLTVPLPNQLHNLPRVAISKRPEVSCRVAGSRVVPVMAGPNQYQDRRWRQASSYNAKRNPAAY
jgi:hypothetical protein